jgi:hypothetical protein
LADPTRTDLHGWNGRLCLWILLPLYVSGFHVVLVSTIIAQIKLATSQLGLSNSEATWGLSIIGVVSTISRIGAGYLSGRFKSQETKILLCGAYLTGASFMVLPACKSFWSYLLANAGIGFVDRLHLRVTSIDVEVVLSFPFFLLLLLTLLEPTTSPKSVFLAIPYLTITRHMALSSHQKHPLLLLVVPLPVRLWLHQAICRRFSLEEGLSSWPPSF